MENYYLTDSQRQLITENHDLIYGFAHKYKLDVDEWYDVCALALCYAATKYDSTKGAFSTIAYWYMFGRVSRHLRNKNRLEFEQSLLRLDKIVEGQDGSTDISSFVGAEDSCYDEVEFMIDLRERMSLLDAREKRIVSMRLQGFDQRGVAKILGLSQAQVSRILRGIKKKILIA